MKQAVALLIAIAALAAPASASALASQPIAAQLAAPVPTVRPAQGSTVTSFPGNVTPNHKALNAYATYLTAILDGAPAAQAANTAYIATISGSNGCKSAPPPLELPSQQGRTAVRHAWPVPGQEMGADL